MPIKAKPITKSDAHVNTVLTSASVCEVNTNQNYVHDSISPILPVAHTSDEYIIYNRASWMRSQMKKRAPGTVAAEAEFDFSKELYKCEQYALLARITDEDRANADSIFELDKNTALFLTQQMLLFKEKKACSDYFRPSVWATEMEGIASGTPKSNQFIQFNQANSSPIETMNNILDDIEEKTGGFRPNSLTMPRRVFTALKNNEEIIDRVKYNGATKGGASYVSAQAIAELLEVDEIKIMNATQNIEAEKVGDNLDLKFINNDSILLQYKSKAATNSRIATACRTFQWKGLYGAKKGHRVLKYRNEDTHSDIVEIQSCFVNKVTCPDMGVLMTNCIGEKVTLPSPKDDNKKAA